MENDKDKKLRDLTPEKDAKGGGGPAGGVVDPVNPAAGLPPASKQVPIDPAPVPPFVAPKPTIGPAK